MLWLLQLACLCLTDETIQLGRFCQEGDTGHLAQHVELYRGKFLENAANVRTVLDGKSALMRLDYAVTTARLATWVFVIKGVDTKGWERGDIKQLPMPLKVTGWYKYKSGGESVEVQILEPVPK